MDAISPTDFITSIVTAFCDIWALPSRFHALFAKFCILGKIEFFIVLCLFYVQKEIYTLEKEIVFLKSSGLPRQEAVRGESPGELPSIFICGQAQAPKATLAQGCIVDPR